MLSVHFWFSHMHILYMVLKWQYNKYVNKLIVCVCAALEEPSVLTTDDDSHNQVCKSLSTLITH